MNYKTLSAGLLLVFAISACSSFHHNGHTFTDHNAQIDGLRNIPHHGFKKTKGNDQICNGNSKLTAGYVVHLRKPKGGEAESDYKNYVEGEMARASVCAKVALWCDTRSQYFCRPDDDKCAREHPNSTRNTCRMRASDVTTERKALGPITQQIGDESWIQCGGDLDEYASPLALAVVKDKTWIKDHGKWMKFCEQHKSKQDCDHLLQHRETQTWFTWPDASRWAVTTLMEEEPTVERVDDKWVGTAEVNLDPACGLMEKRY